MKLVIVESPSKAKTIEKYLGKDYKVLASKGHIADLPKSDLGVDIDNDFAPTYVVTKEASLEKLQQAFAKADELILAVDPDREGEAIGWHVAIQLEAINEKGDTISRGKPVKRIVFSEITKTAITDAVKHPREIDLNLVDAQQARRVLDRIVGYKLSPLLWKKIRFGLSAGRVQSVALKLIVDRERERDAFNPEEYWSLKALLHEKKRNGQPEVVINLSDDETHEFKEGMLFELFRYNGDKTDLTNQKQSEGIISDVLKADWIVSDITAKEQKRSPRPPFTTSTLQQAAANKYGMSAKQTMSIAQKLYEAGYITYMRTDSVNLSADALKQARNFIAKEWGEDYVPDNPRMYKTKSQSAQEAHEAIRPTQMSKTAAGLKLDAAASKIYTIIRNRALASQMQDARIEATQVVVDAGKAQFKLNGQRVLFPGYLAVYQDAVSEQIIPRLKTGQQLYPSQIAGLQHFTKPPARFSEASLIKELEANGIGRPSTYAPTISTIMARKYVEKEGRYLFPTDTGIVVTRLLEKHFPDVVDTGFTADMEEQLDEVAEGKLDWVKMMREFWTPFEKNLLVKEEEIKRDDFTVLGDSEFKCPVCDSAMVIKLGRYGRFHSCSRFPDCKGMRNIDGRTEAELAQEAYDEDFLKTYKPAPKTDDGRDYLLKNGRFGRFWAHPDYPKVKDAKPLEFTTAVFRKIYGTAPKTKDGKKMVLRNGRFGEFWAHPDYPDKKEVIRINKKEVAQKKKELGITA
ncbi:MAG: DNA topoisomerase 1 [candidate division WS6 bacterium OLB20]|uniref:DNA topoisomerase 1 n=1 Tax=candidate division WS6 bacterium OLB20 TaxID=1617426 RepID=A0A136LYC4_9BACT|nr:MAG: DNA topoisomerase 1 [candidate division WS6 bacterium OLB20]